jgi:hypothetical protein
VSAETPQPAAADAPQPAPQADSAAGKPTGNNSLRIAILVVVAAVVGVGVWLAFGHSKNKKSSGTAPVATAIAPISQSARELSNRALTLGQPLYWIGAKKNYHYEFSRTTKGFLYVRYLPKGVKATEKPGKLLIIATYPMTDAYNRLKRGAKGRVVAGKHGSIVWVRTDNPKSVYIAWPHVGYEVEVYSPNASKAARIAESGQVMPVG